MVEKKALVSVHSWHSDMFQVCALSMITFFMEFYICIYLLLVQLCIGSKLGLR